MENVKVTEEQAKTLKLFAYYAQGYGKKEVNIVPFGDLHYGLKFCDKKLVEHIIGKIDKMKDTYVILMGDLIENSSRDSVGTGIYDQLMSPQEQIDGICDLLYPIKDKIILSNRGNHEQRAYRFGGLDVGKTIADKWGCNYSELMAISSVCVGDNDYSIFSCLTIIIIKKCY